MPLARADGRLPAFSVQRDGSLPKYGFLHGSTLRRCCLVTTHVPKSCTTGSMQFMLLPRNFHVPTDEEIHTAFAQGEAAVMALCHEVAAQVAELAQQLAKQGAILHAWQARLAKSSRNSSKPPSSDGYGKGKRTESLRKT